MDNRLQRRGTASSTNSSSKVHSISIPLWSKLQNFTKTVPELIDIADNSAKAGNNEDALRQLIESERIKSVIRDFEQDMWNN